MLKVYEEELYEQSRLLGMSGEREALLRSLLSESLPYLLFLNKELNGYIDYNKLLTLIKRIEEI